MSSDTTRQNPNESRASHGNGEVHSPRRVQWATDDDGFHVTVEPAASRRSSIHALDEMGHDRGAFGALKDALERHQSWEHLEDEGPSSLPTLPPRAAVPLRSNTTAPPTQTNPFAHSQMPLSAYPPVNLNTDNPYHLASAPQVQASESRRTTASSTQQSSPETEVVYDSGLSSRTMVAQRTHDVPGEVWIDPLEREGLPIHTTLPNAPERDRGSVFRRRSTWRQTGEDQHPHLGEQHIERLAEHQAAGVVRAHTRRGWGWLHHRTPSDKRSSKSKHTRGDHTGTKDEKGKTSKRTSYHHRHSHSDAENKPGFNDREFPRPGRERRGVPATWFAPTKHIGAHGHDHSRSHHDHGYAPGLGNGVLSALLALYGHDHEHDNEGSVSGDGSPGRHSRTSSDAESEDDILPKPHRPWVPSQDEKGHGHATSERPKNVKETKPSGKFSLGRSLKGASASSIFAHIRGPSLPASSTTAALIAGAGILTGAAAPQQATLAPNLKRPGYGLVRYSVDEVPLVPPKTPKDDEPESPDTLAATIVASPTADSEHLGYKLRGDQAHPLTTPGERKGWTGRLKDIPLPMHLSSVGFRPGTPREKGLHTPGGSGSATPGSTGGTPVDEFGEKKDYFDVKYMEKEARHIKEQEKKARKERERQREKEVRRKRKKAEVYITRHVAAILQRQEFIMKLARAMMMFGGPSHRLAAQIQSTGRVLDLELSCMYLPDVMLISFEDSATGTSNVKFIRQGSALDLEKLGEAHALYWNVIHDVISVSTASASLDMLMRREPLYNFAQLVLIGGMCSASICSVSFSGSFIDCLVSAPLGALLVAIQLISVRNELYVNVFEITIATLLSFLSAALASTTHFCYSAVASSSVVLILPGFIVLCGSLELSSRSLVAGAVRLCFALMYSLFLGFGLAIGAELYEKILGRSVIAPTDYTCIHSHDPTGPWWQRTPSLWWAFLTVPMYSLFLSLRLMAPWRKKEILLLVAISCIGWVTNHFVSTKFPNQSDISAAVGAFAVGFVSNMYGRFVNGNAFVVMITGILFQVPSGLGNGGLLNFVSDQTSGLSSSYTSGFQTALQLISVAIGLTVGLGISLVVVHPIQSRRRAGGLFSL